MKPDLAKFENPLQLGGIRTGTLDSPGAGGGQPVRVALFDTGAGLRFTVALDRGGDIVDASFKQHAFAYLTPDGLVPQSATFHTGAEWLRGWAGGSGGMDIACDSRAPPPPQRQSASPSPSAATGTCQRQCQRCNETYRRVWNSAP